MIARPELIEFINSQTWEQRNINYVIGAINSNVTTAEPYLMGGLTGYGKYMFWEIPLFIPDVQQIRLGDWIEHCSEIAVVKKYWTNKPWYEEEDSDEARLVKSRVQILNEKVGVETPGMARSCCKDCEYFFFKIQEIDVLKELKL
jgi:hypothetical protein